MASVRKRKWTHDGTEKEAWVVSYTDQGGKRRIKTFDKKKDADRHRTTVESEIERGEHIAPSDSLTVAALADLYLRENDHRLKEGTIGRARHKAIEGALRVHIVPGLGRTSYAEMTEQAVEQWYRGLPAALALRSRRMYLQELCTLERFAIQRKLTVRKPAANFRGTLRGKAKGAIQTFNRDSVVALLMAAEQRPHGAKFRANKRLRLAVHLAAFCGLRRGEIYGLTLDAIDFGRRVIRVRHSMTHWGELKGPKTAAGLRDVPMPDHVAAMLAEWVEKFYAPNDRRLVLTVYRGGNHKAGIADFTKAHQNAWRDLLIRAGLHDAGNKAGQGLHFHALRHFAASWYMAQGMSPPDVARLLGHETFDMTLQVYAHPVYDDSYRQQAINDGATKLMALAAPVIDATPVRQGLVTH